MRVSAPGKGSTGPGPGQPLGAISVTASPSLGCTAGKTTAAEQPLDFTEWHFLTKLATDVFQASEPQIADHLKYPEGITAARRSTCSAATAWSSGTAGRRPEPRWWPRTITTSTC